jgi:hypothetical protein
MASLLWIFVELFKEMRQHDVWKLGVLLRDDAQHAQSICLAARDNAQVKIVDLVLDITYTPPLLRGTLKSLVDAVQGVVQDGDQGVGHAECVGVRYKFLKA